MKSSPTIRKCSPPSRGGRRAFSLLELLVCIAIIAILIGILIPSLSQAREKARATVCASNLRQWALACVTYSQQNGGYLPRRGQGVQPTNVLSRPDDWFNALPPFMGLPGLWDTLQTDNPIPTLSKAPWRCPSADPPAATPYFSYAMNMRLCTWFTPQPTQLVSINDPSTQVFMTEGPSNYGSVLPSNQAYTPIARHNNRINVSFVDGHLDTFLGTYVGCGTADPMHPDVRWIVTGDPWPGPTSLQ